MPVLVRNRETGPTVFSDIAKNIAIEWQGAGDPNGEDVQHVPDEVLENVNFLKAVQRGIFQVEEASPETQEMLEKQVAAYQQRKDATREAGEAALDREAERTIANVSVDEKGKVQTIKAESEQVDPTTGKALETDIPVIIEERQRG